MNTTPTSRTQIPLNIFHTNGFIDPTKISGLHIHRMKMSKLWHTMNELITWPPPSGNKTNTSEINKVPVLSCSYRYQEESPSIGLSLVLLVFQKVGKLTVRNECIPFPVWSDTSRADIPGVPMVRQFCWASRNEKKWTWIFKIFIVEFVIFLNRFWFGRGELQVRRDRRHNFLKLFLKLGLIQQYLQYQTMQ